MNIEIPPEEFRAVAEPLLARVAGELAAQLVKTAEALAQDRTAGCLDKAGVAAYLGQKVRTVENWMRPKSAPGGRGLPHVKIGETVLFMRPRIEAWLLTMERNAPPVQPMEAGN